MGVIAETAVKVRADTSGFHKEAQGGVLSSITRIGGAAAAALGGLAIGKALFVDPIKQAGEFQRSLNVLQATTHATGAQIQAASALAQKLGNDIHLPAVSASDAANAMLLLGKSGFSVSQSMKAVHGTLLLSTAAEVDAGTAATAVTQNINAFGLKAKDTNKIVDQMAGFMNATGTSFTAFSDSLTYVSAPARAVGQSFQETAAQLAILSQNGIDGSQAGTGLRHVLTQLGVDGSKAGKALQQVGVHTFDAHHKFVGIRGVIQQLQPVLEHMTRSDRLKLMSQAFGQNAMNQANILLGQMPGHYDKVLAAIGKHGQAQALANAQTKGFMGALSGLKSTLEGVQLTIGLALIPVLTMFVRFLTAEIPVAMAAIGSVIGTIKSIVGQIAGVVRAHMDEIRAVVQTGIGVLQSVFDGAVSVVQGLIGAITNLISWFNHNRDVALAVAAAVATLAAGYLVYQTYLLVVAAATRVAAAAQLAFNLVMDANPVAIVVIAIAALVGALVLLYQRSETARTIMNAAFEGIKAATSTVFGFITNTVIPNAIAAWNRFGPGVVSALTTAVTVIKTVVQAIATVVSTVVDEIRQHWESVWKVFGPFVTASLQAARTAVATVLNVIAGLVRLFAALLRGDWSGAWNALKGIVSDVLNGVTSIVSTVLSGLAATAKALAITVGNAIGDGIKAGLSALVGLAGDLVGRVTGAISQAAGQAYSLARQIGFAIADGVVSGIGNLGSRIGGALKSAAGSAVSFGLHAIGAKSPSRLFADTIGKAMGDGVVVGFVEASDRGRPRLVAAIRKMGEDLANASKKELPAIQAAYKTWADGAKAAFDNQVGNVQKTIEAGFTRAQAALDRWKAKLTPAEFAIAQAAAAAEVAKVRADVAAAAAELYTLPAKQAAAWSALLAQQQANMAALRATLQSTTDDALLAGNTFQKGMVAAATDPLATNLIAAQKAFDSTKLLFDQGLTDTATFIAAANALDDAKLAASQDSNATTLLDQYNTWQQALAQQAAAGAAITTQQAADEEAQRAQAAQNQTDLKTAKEAYEKALADQDAFWLQKRADSQRAAKDAQYDQLSNHLKSMHDRTLTHLQNVQHAWDLHYDALAKMAAQSGDHIGDNLANALRRSIPTVSAAAAAVANAISQMLKVKSPTERGPMSDLDTWWENLAPTLIQSFDGSKLQAKLGEAVTPPSAATINARGPGLAASATDRWSGQRMELLLERIEKHTAAVAEKPTPNLGATPITVIATGGADAAVIAAKR